jgi:hypothetical protein
MRSGMQTNRELYSFVADLAARHRVGQRSLESYLHAMWGLASGQASRAHWPLDEFAELLAASFVAPEPSFDGRWLEPPPESASGFDRWQHAIVRQVVDLREMGEAGLLTSELRYYGLDAPRGGRWYNLDTCSYLESATAGTFGGLMPDDDSQFTRLDWDRFAAFLLAGASYE